MKRNFPLVLLFLCLFSTQCRSPSEEKRVAFYHWRSHARSSPVIERSLEESGSEEIYMHYFDAGQPAGLLFFG